MGRQACHDIDSTRCSGDCLGNDFAGEIGDSNTVSPETNSYKVLRAGGKRIGYKEITSARTAINPVARNGRPGCQQISFCNSGCAIGAKWSTLYTEVPAAEQTGHFELRSSTMAVRINHDAKGRATGIVYKDADSVMHEQKARAVCVAGNA